MLSERAWAILRCPACHGDLHRAEDGAECSACRTRYPVSAKGQPDLRLRHAKKYSLDVEISPNSAVKPGFEFQPLKSNPNAEVEVSWGPMPAAITYGNRLSRELLSYFPRADSGGGLMLDVGCGGRQFADICRCTNLEYVGLDHQGEQPDVLGDAHALPFADEVFDFILCVAVLEHLRHPWVAMREAYRVLKPRGRLIGTVAFLEPFHMDSYYHHTHLGTYNLLVSAGFDVQQVAPNLQWTALRALAHMNLFHGLPASVVDLLVLPLRVLNRFWWTWEDIHYRTGGSWEIWRQVSTTGGYRFVAIKPEGI